MPKHTLTGNDLACAEAAAMHAIRAVERIYGKTAAGRKQSARYKALIEKLSAIVDHAYPYEGCMPSDTGDDPIMRLDAETVKATRAAARRADRRAA